MADAKSETLLVTGAGGQLGRQVVEDLLRRGATRLIATTRDPAKLSDLAARGVDVRAADFDRPETLGPAFEGANRLLLISTDAMHTPGARVRQHRAVIAAATRSGVRHLVYTSLPNAHPTPESSVADDHFWTEAALFESGLDWTILRNNLYAEFILFWAAPAIKSGRLVSAAGAGGRSYVTREDCARTAAGALLKSEGREIHDVTGPAPITQIELAVELSAMSGRTIVHEPATPEDVRRRWLTAGLPAFVAQAAHDFDVDASRGYQAIVTPTVERLSGRAPTSVIEFLRSRRAAILKIAEG